MSHDTGFDAAEPRAGLIAIFAAGAIAALVVVVLGTQAYFDHAREQQVYEKVLAPVSDDLLNLRAREEQQLHSYGFVDANKTVVRLPIERAMELLTKEYTAGKVKYSTKPTPVRPPEPPPAAVPVKSPDSANAPAKAN